MAKTTPSYEELQKELDEILRKIQEEDAKGSLTELLGLYEKGEALIEQMQAHLEKAKNSIKKLQ